MKLEHGGHKETGCENVNYANVFAQISAHKFVWTHLSALQKPSNLFGGPIA